MNFIFYGWVYMFPYLALEDTFRLLFSAVHMTGKTMAFFISVPHREKNNSAQSAEVNDIWNPCPAIEMKRSLRERYEWRNFQWFMERPSLCLCPKSPIASHQSNFKTEFGDKSEKCDGRARKLTPVLTNEFSDSSFPPHYPRHMPSVTSWILLV